MKRLKNTCEGKFLAEMAAVASEKAPTSLKLSYISANELNSKGIQIRLAREIIAADSAHLIKSTDMLQISYLS
jgi:hypothetical protein